MEADFDAQSSPASAFRLEVFGAEGESCNESDSWLSSEGYKSESKVSSEGYKSESKDGDNGDDNGGYGLPDEQLLSPASSPAAKQSPAPSAKKSRSSAQQRLSPSQDSVGASPQESDGAGQPLLSRLLAQYNFKSWGVVGGMT